MCIKRRNFGEKLVRARARVLRVWLLNLTFQGIPVISVTFSILDLLENYFRPLRMRFKGLQVACAADECSTELLYITAGMQSASLFFCASHDYAG